jgi:hypothetical protein
MIESKIEKYLFEEIKKLGGMCLKWVSPGNKGVPDRIIFLNKQIWFIELKSTTGERTKLQIFFEKLLLQYTNNYKVINSKEQVDIFIKDILK